MKALKIFGIFTFSFICIIGIISPDVTGNKNNLLASLLCGIISIALFISLRKSAKKQRQKNTAQNEYRQQLLNSIENNSLPPLSTPSIFLKKNELAYYEQPATLLITQNKAVGSTGGSSGSSVRVAKGVYLRSGSSGRRRIYKDVTTKYTGCLSVTNQRISFMQAQKSFEVSLDKITNIVSTPDTLILQKTNKSFTLELPNADVIEKLIRKLCLKQN
ncbi:MAG: hypothetical protein V8S27_09425 [Lachnospiraceae bacterium]